MLDFDDKSLFDEKGSHKDFHNNDRIDSFEANVNMVIGRRANGKSYSTLAFDGIKKFLDSDYVDQFAYIRRFDSEMSLVQKDIFNGMVQNGWLSWYTDGEWNDVQYWQHKWFLRQLDDDGVVVRKCTTPMAYAFCVSTAGKAKGPDYVNIKTAIFDEFIPTNAIYAPHELEQWQNLISTLDRNRNQIKIYMIANTISKMCPHFDYYGVDPDTLDQGKIYIFKCGTKGKLAVEYCSDVGSVETLESVYFNRDDEIGAMILGGDWQLRRFPALPDNFDLDQLTSYKFYLVLKGKIIEGRFLTTDGASTIYFAPYDDKIDVDQIVYLDEWYSDAIALQNVHVGLRPSDPIAKLILSKIAQCRCYYASDDIGEKVAYFSTL